MMTWQIAFDGKARGDNVARITFVGVDVTSSPTYKGGGGGVFLELTRG